MIEQQQETGKEAWSTTAQRSVPQQLNLTNGISCGRATSCYRISWSSLLLFLILKATYSIIIVQEIWRQCFPSDFDKVNQCTMIKVGSGHGTKDRLSKRLTGCVAHNASPKDILQITTNVIYFFCLLHCILRLIILLPHQKFWRWALPAGYLDHLKNANFSEREKKPKNKNIKTPTILTFLKSDIQLGQILITLLNIV